MVEMLKVNKKISFSIPYVLISLATFLVGLILYQYPGLYEDTMLPSSLGVSILYPNNQNVPFPLMHSGIAFVPGNHYGAYSSWYQMLVVLIARGGHLLSFRISILILVAGLNCLLYYILQKTTENRLLSLITALVSATCVNTNVFSRSQYDIMFIGAILQLLSIYSLYLAETKSLESKYVQKKIFLAGILQGLAFYGYFSYLFMYPALVLWAIFRKRGSERNKLILLSISGLLFGSSFYFFGYADAVLTSILGKSVKVVLCLVFLATIFYIFAGIPAYLIFKDKTGKRKKVLLVIEILIFLFALLVFICVLFAGKDYILSYIQRSRSTQFKQVQKPNRFILFFIYIKQVLAGDRVIQMTNGEIIPFAGYVQVFAFFISFVTCLYFKFVKNKEKARSNSSMLLNILYLYIGSFYISSLPIIKSMWGQHFLIMQYIMLMLIALQIHEIFTSSFAKPHQIIKKCSLALIFTLLFLANIYENHCFFKLLMKSGGKGPYSQQLTQMCLDANQKYKEGDKELYLFMDWGFKEPFVYLTNNQVLYRAQEFDEKEVNNYLNAGYKVIYCAWKQEDIEKIKNNITLNNILVKEDRLLQLDSEPAIYLLSQKLTD